MNLFFVHTPSQLINAQNIIIQKKLSNNGLILSHTGEQAMHFYSLFDIIIIDRLWSFKQIGGDINQTLFNIKSLVSSFSCLFRYLNKVKKIIKNQSVEALYFGDINHFTYIFLAEKFKQNRKIYFFEEGISHYFYTINKKKFDNGIGVSIKKWVADHLVFNLLGVNNFSKYLYATSDCDFGFDIEKKYNLINKIENTYEENIKFHLHTSEKLNQIILTEIKKIPYKKNTKIILYLSSSTSYLFTNSEEDEQKVLDILFDKQDLTNIFVLVKPHPKDPERKKMLLADYFKKKGIQHLYIFQNQPLPAEVLFPNLRIDTIVGFDSSSLLYGKAFLNNSSILSLLPNLLEIYQHEGIKNPTIEQIWKQVSTTYFEMFDCDLKKVNHPETIG